MTAVKTQITALDIVMPQMNHENFYEIASLAATICGVEQAAISLTDGQTQFFKATHGIEITELPMSLSFCRYALLSDDIFEIPDTLKDELFATHSLVAGPAQIRFYAGIPLTTHDGRKVGTICILDRAPRTLTDAQKTCLRVLSRQVATTMELLKTTEQLHDALMLSDQHARSLEGQNKELQHVNMELLSSEEEILSNLEFITLLQADLERTEKQYRELIDDANDIIYELDNAGKFCFVNPAMVSVTRYEKSKLIGMIYTDLIHPDDRQQVNDFYRVQRKTKTQQSYLEFRIVCADGSQIWVGQNVNMFFDGASYVCKVSAVSRDITTLKNMQHRLEKSEEIYRLISTNTRDLVTLYEANDEATRTFVSPSVKNILGYEVEELVGKSPFDLIHVDDRERVRDLTKRITLNGQPATMEYRVFRKDGTMIWLESNSQPFFNAAGEIVGFQASAREITKRKEFEMSLHEAKQKAEHATNAKTEFLSMMSHEIRTPMNAIIGLTNILLSDSPMDSQKEYLELMQFAGKNLLTIINDILDFSKIEAGKLQLEETPFDLQALVMNTKMMLLPKAKEKGLTLTVSYDKQLPRTLVGDPVRIAQILMNLAGNAIKFTETGKVEVLFSQSAFDGHSHAINIKVKDTGIGIAPEHLDKVFDRFSQADSYTTRKFGGTGLGLAITKNIVELMGGNISVTSTCGVGSIFEISIRLKGAAQEAEPIPVKSLVEEASPRNIRVLLVEDNAVNQIVASSYLKKWNMGVSIAANGQEAVKAIESKAYDVILMDLQMPIMDGYEATKIIRAKADQYFQRLPIIALTASAMMGMKDMVLDVGMDDFVSKPFDPAELHEKILGAINSKMVVAA
jgi:PAS domain S-box-containing protein